MLLAAEPVIAKIAPPDWFIDLQLNPVLLLVEGRDLQGVTVNSTDPRLAASVLQVSANGHYLFVELTVPPGTAPGAYPLVFRNGAGEIRVTFELRPSCHAFHEPAGFGPEDTVYLLMPDRFADGDPGNNIQASNAAESSRDNPRGWHGGDFAGIRQHLDYFVQLGITTLWTTPVFENAGAISYHGYHITDHFATDPHFGRLDEFAALVREAHSRGLKVIQDQITNHTGPEHRWVDDPPTPTWFNGTRAAHLSCDWNIGGLASPHSTPTDRDRTVRGWFAGILPDLNSDDPLLRRYLIQVSLWWVARTGLDGIRMDTYPYTDYSFWQEWFPALRREFPRLGVVGEVMEWTPPLVAYWQQDAPKTDGSSEGPLSLMDFPTTRVLPEVYTRPDGWKAIRDMYRLDYCYPHPERLFTLMDNHDMTRFRTAVGDSGALYRNALAVLLLLRGIPQIYAGDEIALAGGPDPDNRRDFPGGFPGGGPDAFTGQGLGADEAAALAWVRQLLAARRRYPVLRTGGFTEIFADADVLAVRKEAGGGSALLIFHRGGREREFHWDQTAFQPRLDGHYRSVLSPGGTLEVQGNSFNSRLLPYDVQIWIKE
jgi:glycosidase